MEIWKQHPIHDFLSLSTLGRVMVNPYEVKMPRGGVRTYGGKPHYGNSDGHGRLHFQSRQRKFRKKVHILVCETFHGLKPFEEAVVMHLDDDSENNRPDNLKWGTQKENLNTESFITYCKSKTGENSNWSKHFKSPF